MFCLLLITSSKDFLNLLLIVLLLGVIAAWIASGKVLKPLQNLTLTVSSIDESDLEQRIAMTGLGEIAELTKRFNQRSR